MRVTKEEATAMLEDMVRRAAGMQEGLYLDLFNFIRRVRAYAPSKAAVERDRQRGKKTQSAAQTG